MTRTISDLQVLYLEDEVLIALDGADILRDMGFASVHVSTSLKKAEAILRNSPVDIAILDVNLGQGLNSFDLAQEVQRRGIPFVFVSGYNKNEFPEDLKSMGIINKPFSSETLSAQIQKIVELCEGAA